MKNKHLVLFFLIVSLLSGVTIFTACKRINAFTDIGSGLIPAVDNINTFDTVLNVEVYNGIFGDNEDSIRMLSSEIHFLGQISNDPFFGKTDARIYLQLKPTLFPHAFARADSLTIDSVVLVLDYKGAYGDTTIPQTINVYEIANIPTNVFRADSNYLVKSTTFVNGDLLGSRTIVPQNLKDTVKAYKDTTVSQLRIRLSDLFGQRMLDYDSTAGGAYKSDSLLNTYFKGLAIESAAGSGNALMAFALANAPNTKLAFYYRYPKNGQPDTTVSYFTFSPYSIFSSIGCASHNYVKRDFTGSPLEAAANSPAADDFVYLINSPGSYATIKIPGLQNVSNRLVHRAELVAEQIYDPSDDIFFAPESIWMDAYDSSISSYRVIPYDLYPGGSGTLNLASFGSYGNTVPNGSGKDVARWSFDLTRYVQKIVTEGQKVMDFRMMSHRYSTDSIRLNNFDNSGNFTNYVQTLNNNYVTGRVRLGGTAHPTRRMKLRIIYSKI
ncbi:MAG: DUF4270 family protein [Chitinophagales bacterium]|nr:DUF4270 family protein [Chitinophagales bacterium]